MVNNFYVLSFYLLLFKEVHPYHSKELWAPRKLNFSKLSQSPSSSLAGWLRLALFFLDPATPSPTSPPTVKVHLAATFQPILILIVPILGKSIFFLRKNLLISTLARQNLLFLNNLLRN